MCACFKLLPSIPLEQTEEMHQEASAADGKHITERCLRREIPQMKADFNEHCVSRPTSSNSGKLKKEHPTCVCWHKGPLWFGRCYQPSRATAAAFQWRLPRITHCSLGGLTPLGGISWHPVQMEVGGAGRPARLMTKISGYRGATSGEQANKALSNHRCDYWFIKCCPFCWL